MPIRQCRELFPRWHYLDDPSARALGNIPAAVHDYPCTHSRGREALTLVRLSTLARRGNNLSTHQTLARPQRDLIQRDGAQRAHR